MQEIANQVVDVLNSLIWGKVLIWLLVGCGLYFTARLGLIQFRHFGHIFSVLRGSRLALNAMPAALTPRPAQKSSTW